MNEPVISVEHLSKRYIIGHQVNGDGLRHALESMVRSPLRWLRNRAQTNARKHEEFWALRDVNFQVRKGDVVGFVGRNGAGKSTLLKLLSRISEPTSGRIRLKGRVASLLEVGTGFHPELTGRENIFLNGAILGMSRSEIRRKFDEIVAFSELGEFIEMPVRSYSSGMVMRLAFSVATAVEPDILIVDEILSVGDESFQQKSSKRMMELMSGGTTVLYVSHSLASVREICDRVLWLEKGHVRMMGDVQEVCNAYQNS